VTAPIPAQAFITEYEERKAM